ncbi:Iron-sulfur cluster regulator IscR [invertebrate metagenome]|uniref:Iron-sulfur cluster regulator IscR n=1 Tax=invertebrate metagenome TaxID=1711999 RepID=A0A484H6D1_9ZZZZ
MIRINRLTDYAVLVLAELLRAEGPHTVSQIATCTSIPLPTVAKLLKILSQSGLVTSYRGVTGGYSLRHPAATITVADIIEAMEGPIAITTCIEGSDKICRIESLCPMQGHWNRINHAIRRVLEDVSLNDIAISWSSCTGKEEMT